MSLVITRLPEPDFIRVGGVDRDHLLDIADANLPDARTLCRTMKAKRVELGTGDRPMCGTCERLARDRTEHASRP